MSEYDPDELFSLEGIDPIEGLRQLLSVQVEPEEPDEEQAEYETEG